MKTWVTWIFVVGLSLLQVGCGGDKEFKHDDVAKIFIAALQARPNDKDKCVELMTEVIEKRPMDAAYFHRAWIYAEQGKIEEAKADVAAGLKLQPESTDLKWLEGELNKPASRRSLEMPPSTTK